MKISRSVSSPILEGSGGDVQPASLSICEYFFVEDIILRISFMDVCNPAVTLAVTPKLILTFISIVPPSPLTQQLY